MEVTRLIRREHERIGRELFRQESSADWLPCEPRVLERMLAFLQSEGRILLPAVLFLSPDLANALAARLERMRSRTERALSMCHQGSAQAAQALLDLRRKWVKHAAQEREDWQNELGALFTGAERCHLGGEMLLFLASLRRQPAAPMWQRLAARMSSPLGRDGARRRNAGRRHAPVLRDVAGVRAG
jgi:hypothetical protein